MQSHGGVVTRCVSAKSLSCIVPTGTLCSTSPSLPWGLWASVPHLPRYYATLRLPPAPLGVLRLSLVPRYLACCPRSWSPCRARDQAEAPGHARACGHPVPQAGSMVKETGGSPTLPRSPSAAMPRSQTPVVSCALVIAHPGLRPARAWKPWQKCRLNFLSAKDRDGEIDLVVNMRHGMSPLTPSPQCVQ
jgi:hypothetical protein